MQRRRFLAVAASVIGGSTLAGEAAGEDSKLEPGTWYDATVTDVTDGDTMDVVLDDGTEYELRILGIDTPETRRNGRYEEIREWEGIEDDKYLAQWGENAKDYAQNEFPDGTQVQVAVDEAEDEIDPFGRLLAYVRYDQNGDGSFDTLYNRDAIAKGYARVYGSSLTKHDDFWNVEDDARAAGTGVWGQSDPENTSSVDDDPVSTLWFPNASSVRTDAGAIADSRVPVYAESTAYQQLDGGIDYSRIPMVGVDESVNAALVGSLPIDESLEDDAVGQHQVFLTNLIDYLSSKTGQVLIDGGHHQFNADHALSNEDAVVYQRYLEGQGLAFEQVNTLDGAGDNALSTARAIVITSPADAFTTGEVDALSTFVSNGGAVILMGSALATSTQRSNLDALAADLGSDLRINGDQVVDDSNNAGDPASPTTSVFDTSFPLFDAYGGGGGGDTTVAVSTGSASSVGTDSATLSGSLDDLGGADSADCYFEYRQTGASSWSQTSAQTLSATGSFSDSISGLVSGTEYEFRAVAAASDGDGDTGTTATFTTDSGGSTAPAIDQFALSDRSNGGWARVDVDWAVSDADGDLASVELVMTQDGATVDSATESVSGGSASGSTRLEDKKGSGTYDVTLTVTDAAGSTTSSTKSITV